MTPRRPRSGRRRTRQISAAISGASYLMGHSAGAHMAALLTLDSRYFAAAGRAVSRILPA